MSGAAEQTPVAESGRIRHRFEALRREGRAGLVTFVTAGDPDHGTCAALLQHLPGAGADLIELGMPFTDPMADGPAIQAASLRAIKAGATMERTLDLVAGFRQQDDETPVVLMGYYNPIFRFGTERFLDAARQAGVDGLIVVDVPPEEDEELCLPALHAGLNFIRLATPTSDDVRLRTVLRHTSGFVYYVAITGITGTSTADNVDIATAVTRLRRHTALPVAVGFGIKIPMQAGAVARVADAAVVGSAIVGRIADHLDGDGRPQPSLVPAVVELVEALAAGVRAGRDKDRSIGNAT